MVSLLGALMSRHDASLAQLRHRGHRYVPLQPKAPGGHLQHV